MSTDAAITTTVPIEGAAIKEQPSSLPMHASLPKRQFPPTMTPKTRQDVLVLKQQLADALGENGPLYWDALKDFVSGKLNRQEFDFYANLYLSQRNADLHNAFILSTVHNAQTNLPPPSKQRSVGWAKRKRGKDGLLDSDQDRDPQKKRLKMDVMALSKADRDQLKALIKAGDKEKLRPFVDRLLAPRISRPPSLPFLPDHPGLHNDFVRGIQAPLCADLKELPSPEILHARMTAIALENGLTGGVTDDSVTALLFAVESHIKSVIASTITKRRVNRPIGLKMRMSTPSAQTVSQQPSQSLTYANSIRDKDSKGGQVDTDSHMAENNIPSNHSDTSSSGGRDPSDSIRLRDVAFSFQISPYVVVENPLNAEKLTALLTESEDEEIDDELGETSSDGEFDL